MSLKVLIFELVAKTEKLRKLDREIELTFNETRLANLIAERSNVRSIVSGLRAKIADRVSRPVRSDFTILEVIC
jgi:hypothetical protein